MENGKKIKIEYDGSYPSLCGGNLKVHINKKEWIFPKFCMASGGSVSFTNDWDEVITQGEWSIIKWPDGFPKKFKIDVLIAINSEIPFGCCGGCV